MSHRDSLLVFLIDELLTLAMVSSLYISCDRRDRICFGQVGITKHLEGLPILRLN